MVRRLHKSPGGPPTGPAPTWHSTAITMLPTVFPVPYLTPLRLSCNRQLVPRHLSPSFTQPPTPDSFCFVCLFTSWLFFIIASYFVTFPPSLLPPKLLKQKAVERLKKIILKFGSSFLMSEAVFCHVSYALFFSVVQNNTLSCLFITF